MGMTYATVHLGEILAHVVKIEKRRLFWWLTTGLVMSHLHRSVVVIDDLLCKHMATGQRGNTGL